MKLTFGIITLNAEFFIRNVLESIYPFAHRIIIADGPVKWWYDQGVTGSTDGTIRAIQDFYDPKDKIVLIRPKPEQPFYTEKDEQCRAWFEYVPGDTDYVVCNDADEVHSPDNLEKLIQFLEKENPTSVGFKSDSFFGGFDRIIGGFERDHSFKRVLKYVPDCYYRTHRQPTLALPPVKPDAFYMSPYQTDARGNDIAGKDISGNQLYGETGITMWHGSYVSPVGVNSKIQYYENAVIAKGQCIPDYFREVWLNWVVFPEKRNEIEAKWKGVQEFVPWARGECFTEAYTGQHPPSIQKNMEALKAKFALELSIFKKIHKL